MMNGCKKTLIASNCFITPMLGHRVTADNFKSYRQARTYNTSVVQEKESDKMYFKRTIDKGVRSNRYRDSLFSSLSTRRDTGTGQIESLQIVS